jgi:type IV pilus assembly protein PilA
MINVVILDVHLDLNLTLNSQKMKNSSLSQSRKGFSLVELLVVIAVIGIIAAIAIPAMSGIFGEGEEAKNRRNAQAIVSTFNAARAAGNQTSYDKTNAINAITTTTGITGGGTFTNSTFASPMGSAEKTAASALIGGLATANSSGFLVIN